MPKLGWFVGKYTLFFKKKGNMPKKIFLHRNPVVFVTCLRNETYLLHPLMTISKAFMYFYAK